MACIGTGLLIDCMGGGRSYVMRITGIFLHQILIICVPLLVLVLDVCALFITEQQQFGTIHEIYFHECIGDKTNT